MARRIRGVTRHKEIEAAVYSETVTIGTFDGPAVETIDEGYGGLTFPVNPDGGGSGVFIDNQNSASETYTQGPATREINYPHIAQVNFNGVPTPYPTLEERDEIARRWRAATERSFSNEQFFGVGGRVLSPGERDSE